MLPNSFTFLAFFAAIAITYYVVPHRWRWPLLLLTSVYFYSTFEPVYLLLLGAVTGVTYLAALALDRPGGEGSRKAILTLSVLAVISALLVFKYYDFFLDSLEGLFTSQFFASRTVFPTFPRLDLVVFVGLSFYTFSCVSYLADVYERRIAPERHFGHFALYVSFFPKLLAGPIERAGPFLAQIKAPVSFSAAGVAVGLQLVLWGLFKKVVIADRLALFVDAAYAQPAFAAPADLLIATYFFAFQLYCDFSGYSDMAIGMSMVLGIKLMENFRRPYLSTSTVEFWAKRWHLSLASWFRDYMYIPLGGNRVSRFRQYFNVMAVFVVSGLWHGANWTFVVWGALNGLYNVLSQMTRGVRERVGGILPVPAAVGRVWAALVTFHLVLITWVFFRADSIGDATTVYQRIAGAAGQLPGLLAQRIGAGDVLFPVGLIAVLLLVEIIDERRPVVERLELQPVYLRWGLYYATILALLIFGTWQLNSFVYMQF